MAPPAAETVKAALASGPELPKLLYVNATPSHPILQAILPTVLGVLAVAAWWAALAAVALLLGGAR